MEEDRCPQRRSHQTGHKIQNKLQLVTRKRTNGTYLWPDGNDSRILGLSTPCTTTSPPNTPNYLDDATDEELRDAKQTHGILRRDHAVLTGFIRGFVESFMEAVDLDRYQDLEHRRYGYDGVWPECFFAELAIRCPLDIQSVADAR